MHRHEVTWDCSGWRQHPIPAVGQSEFGVCASLVKKACVSACVCACVRVCSSEAAESYGIGCGPPSTLSLIHI
eukprot:10463009-Alexandrium_andersonii.AAC.1